MPASLFAFLRAAGTALRAAGTALFAAGTVLLAAGTAFTADTALAAPFTPLQPPTRFDTPPAPAASSDKKSDKSDKNSAPPTAYPTGSAAPYAQRNRNVALVNPAIKKPRPTSLVNLDTTLRNWGFTRTATITKNLATWRFQNVRFEAEKDKNVVELQGIRLFLEKPVSEKNGTWSIPLSDYHNTLLPILSTESSTPMPPRLVKHVLLDPGHGGKDPGFSNPSLKLLEKNLTLDVANRLKTLLEKKYKLRVTLTRTDDRPLTLAERSALTRKLNADLFLSIHFNGAPSKTADGIETYILTPQGQGSTNDTTGAASKRAIAAREIAHSQNTWNVILGFHLQRCLKTNLRADDRGLRRARFGVLKGTSCPGALVECGFLSNNAEAKKIADPKHRQKIADALADAINDYAGAMARLAATRQPAAGKNDASAPAPAKKSPASQQKSGDNSGSPFRMR